MSKLSGFLLQVVLSVVFEIGLLQIAVRIKWKGTPPVEGALTTWNKALLVPWRRHTLARCLDVWFFRATSCVYVDKNFCWVPTSTTIASGVIQFRYLVMTDNCGITTGCGKWSWRFYHLAISKYTRKKRLVNCSGLSTLPIFTYKMICNFIIHGSITNRFVSLKCMVIDV